MERASQLTGENYRRLMEELYISPTYEEIDSELQEKYNFSLYKKNGDIKAFDEVFIEIQLLQMGIELYRPDGSMKSISETLLEYESKSMEDKI